MSKNHTEIIQIAENSPESSNTKKVQALFEKYLEKRGKVQLKHAVNQNPFTSSTNYH